MIKRLLVGGLLTVSMASIASAQPYPNKAITLVLPVQSGGSSDLASRVYAQHVSESVGQPVVVESRGGGGGVIGSLLVKEARPDGYTLLLANSGSAAILPAIQKLTFDPMTDFEHIAMLFFAPNVLAVPSGLRINTVAELVGLAKKKPGGLSYASQGVGSGGHFLGAMFQEAVGVPMENIPFKGGAPAVVDLVAGRVDLSFTSYSSVKQHAADGRVKILAMISDKRWERIADVPTIGEAGFPGVQLETWVGLMAPSKTPRDVVGKINAEFVKASRHPALIKRLDDMDVQTGAGTPEEFRARLKSDMERLAEVAKRNKMKAE